MIRVAIVEDDKDIREGLALVIKNSDDFALEAVYSSGNGALEGMNSSSPDIVIMDIGLPDISGIECVKRLKEKHPETLFMMCTVFEEDDKIFDSLKAGATGYILKKMPSAKILESLLDLYHGGSPMSSQIARKVIQSFSTGKQAKSVDEYGLSDREKEILELLSHGFQYKQIADKLQLSIETVRTHIRNTYKKLQVQSRTDALNKTFGRSNN
ncbi:MAG TPA: response regulator transcription factor [Bacteroidia bacterium]|jgi:DNA-binding NarL/FixJ family response regulator|nr:response regulator transcription factor [Bacteroidia bacterium]